MLLVILLFNWYGYSVLIPIFVNIGQIFSYAYYTLLWGVGNLTSDSLSCTFRFNSESISSADSSEGGGYLEGLRPLPFTSFRDFVTQALLYKGLCRPFFSSIH